MKSLYTHDPSQPFHISVGAILVNEEGNILAHKVQKKRMPAPLRYKLGTLDEAYFLMRESLENGETLEEAVLRGLREEFGAEARVEMYLGSIQAQIPEDEHFEKTTLYFVARLTKQSDRPTDDAEAHSELIWMNPKKLVEKMRAQGRDGTREDLDESKVVDAYIRYAST